MKRCLSAAVMAIILAGCNEEPTPPPDRDPAVTGPSSTFGSFADQAAALAAKESPPRITAFPAQVQLTPEIPTSTLVIRNDGMAALGISDLGFDGDQAISSTPTCSTRQTLPPGGTCQFQLSYKPSAEPRFGRVYVLPHAPATPASIKVIGQPTAPQAQLPPIPPPADNRGELEALRLKAAMAGVDAAGVRVDPLPAVIPAPAAPTVAVEEPYDEVYIPEAASPPRDMRRVLGNDRYLQLTLLDPIITDNPGDVFAQVTWDVPGGLDPAKPNLPSPTLIPAGSMMRGNYIPAKGKRAQIQWTWLKLPSGSVIDLDNWRSYDAMGQAGVPGEMNHRYAERFGPYLLTTLMAAGAALAGRDTTSAVLGPLGSVSQTSTARSRASDVLTNGLQELGTNVINDDDSIEKRLELAVGTTITVKTEFEIFIPEPGQPLPAAYAGQARKRQENSKRDRAKRNAPPAPAPAQSPPPTPTPRPGTTSPSDLASTMSIPVTPYIFTNGNLYRTQQ